MARAIQLAGRGLYTTRPNPCVGAVVVQQGGIVGEGWHMRAGEPHAEIHALRDVAVNGKSTTGATVYVTLEPCSHQGRTPPCADALIEAGVSRAVVAMEDPNPAVAGDGLARLREAGIEVTVGVMKDDAAALNPGYISCHTRGRPSVRCKLAMSLDGRTAMASGESKWITSPAARQDVQRLRARSDAIITGIGTLLADNPRLDVRTDGIAELEQMVDEGKYRQPLRVIVDSNLRTPPKCRAIALPGKKLIATSLEATEQQIAEFRTRDAEVHSYRGADGRVDLESLLKGLADTQINEVMVEAGPQLCGAMILAGLIDELVLYVAPHLMGDTGQGLMTLPGIEKMAQRLPLKMVDVRAVGDDWRLTLHPESV